ncbi:V-type ATP synthase subunit D [Nitrincola tapanii]|uniref:V-type ATP synthase subunit D n=1 Tax=Nitrincola tapanii TaxID=1708751 RepID=A0A5A9W6Y8_9GAMM|nr:V-type ATP synthase subunit D [Nitrincola tapanii]KAA0876486.1 V-type ATP synthase subunit D [Nitrincola tapanii]
MTRLALNKSTLNKEGRKVKAYQKFVPALDLKRKQLLAARVSTEKEKHAQEAGLQALQALVKAQLPMLPQFQGRVTDLVRIKSLQLSETNLVGIRLPLLQSLEIEIPPYSCLASAHWLDRLSEQLCEMVRLKTQLQITEQRLRLLNRGLQKTTQRLNLFDKVLIPQSQKNIRKIHIALADAERAGVVRAKIAKNKRLKASA